MRIVYFGYDLFADCFEKIASMQGIEIMAVYTFKTDDIFEFNSRIRSIAQGKNIPVHTEKITASALEEYFDNGCDLTLSAGYIYKIPILKRSEFKGINIHPALLPIGRGAWPYPVTILKGLRRSGVTVHKITDRFDEGDILLQRGFSVDRNETLDTLTQKSQIVASELITECLCDFKNLWDNAKPQGAGEYWPEPEDSDRTITADMTVSRAERIVRAFGSYGVIYGGEEFKGDTQREVLVGLSDGTLKLKY